MTLKQRNHILTTLAIFSIICIILSTIILFVSLFKKTLIAPPNTIRAIQLFKSDSFPPVNFVAILLSCLFLMITTPVQLLSLPRYFGKTQSTELIYFAGFSIGVFCEIFRFLILCIGLWQTFSDLLLIFGRGIIFGRTLAVLSFFFAATMSESSQRQDNIRNFLLMISVSIMISITTPLNSARILSTGMVTIGFQASFNSLIVIIVLISAIAFFHKFRKYYKKEFKLLSFVFILLMLGYALILGSDNFLTFPIGVALYIYGAYKYLQTIHTLYFWK